ncbi:regulator of nonsense transcripts UPF3 [Carica papaya]|uniref:regulator of nonsense transcripts UPF3 n=1 Tax=Carica papaya TaxID=3649 RepID=UPI000B8D05D4|nr:regulator of nonsense transcripts UPF3 [Carica papaya]
MKGPLDRTKVVLRHLPPAISQATLMEQIDVAFSGRYNWVSFRPGKGSQRQQSYSRAYIDFKRPDDVLEFAEFFNGHVFVNEKGTQFRPIVEYAPSQRVPKQWSKKDGREGTIFKDPEYLSLLVFPHLAFAGASKETPIVTPLMDFVRQKRAAKDGSRRSSSNGKPSRRATGSSGRSPGSTSSKRNSEKRRVSTTMYILRDSVKNTSSKDKSAYVLVSKQDDQQLSAKPVTLGSTAGTEALEEDSGPSGIIDGGKKKVLLLKGKEKDISHVSSNILQREGVTSTVKNILGSAAGRSNPRRESSGKIIRSILLNKEARHGQSSSLQSESQMQTSNLEKDKRPPRPAHTQLVLKDTNGSVEGKAIGNELHGLCGEKAEKRTRNKDRPDRSVWALRRSDGSFASDESLSSASQLGKSLDSAEGNHGDVRVEISNTRIGETKMFGSGRSSHSSLDNGSSHKHIGRRGPAYNAKDSDGPSTMSEGRHGKICG